MMVCNYLKKLKNFAQQLPKTRHDSTVCKRTQRVTSISNRVNSVRSCWPTHVASVCRGIYWDWQSYLCIHCLWYIFQKKKERKESYIILLVWTDLKCPIELRVQSAPLTCAIDFAIYAIKYLMNISGVEESLGVDQTMLDQDLLWTKNIYIDLHQICSG